MTSDTQQASKGEVIGPYRVRMKLREGAFAQLFLVDAFEDGRQLLVKLARENGLKSELAWQREFALGSRLCHPHLGSVQDFGRAPNGHPFLVLPFYPGSPLSETSAPCGESEILRIGVALAAALAEIHAHGWVHRDVAPANVLVESDGHVRLVDFGMLAPVDEASAGACGTPLFMAPEALEGRTAGSAADLYSLGAVLYRLACGKAPFEELEPEALLAAVLTTPPEPLQARAPHLSPALVALIMRCLVKEPADRPASAEQVLETLLKLKGDALPQLGDGRWQPTAAFERWVGLDYAQGVFAFVGANGLGRTRHLREAHRHARRASRPACRFGPEEGDGPYGMLERLWRWAVASAPNKTEELPLAVRAAIAALWPWAFPHVRPVHEPAKLIRALQDALCEMIPAEQVLLIDDWDAVDAASRAVLTGGFAGPLGERHWLLACRQPPGVGQALALEPMTREKFEPWLATCVSRRLPERLVARMWEFSEGNPGWAAAGLRHLLGTGQLDESAGWSLPETLEALLEAQWARLSLEQKALAEVLALYGLPFTTADLIPLTALLPANWPLELSKLVACEFLRLDGGSYHFRQGVLASWIRERMAPPRRAKLAEQLAHLLVPPGDALRDPPQLYRLAMLYAQSDATAPRIQYALEAGRAYAALFANEAALALFASGLAAIEQNPEPQRFRAQRLALRIAQADVQRLTGELEAAEATYTACLEEVAEPAERARLLVSLGKTHQMLNRFEPARQALEQALAVLAPLEAQEERLRALLALGRVLYYLGDREGAARRAHEALTIARAHGALQPLAEALSFLGNSLVEAGRLEGLDYLREALALRERLGDAQGTNDTHMLLGNALLQAGRFGEARAHFEANRALAHQIGHHQEEAFACVNAALCECELGGWPEAARLLEDVRSLAGRDDFLLGLACFIESYVRLQLGELPAVEACLKEAREREAQLGSAYLRLFGLLYEAERHLFLGGFEQARRAAELGLGLIEKGTGTETRRWAFLLLAEALIWQDQLDAAERAVAQAREAAPGDSARAGRLEGWIAFQRGEVPSAQKTWRAALESARAGGLQQLEARLLLDLHLAERQAGRVGDGAELASAYALAEKQRAPETLALCCLGLALAYLETGQELLAERLSRRGHELLGQLTQALGSPAARQAFSLHPARAPFCEVRGPEEVQRLVQKSRRLEMLLTLGHTLGTTHDVDAVLKQVRSFTLELTQAERCLILLGNGQELRQFGVAEGYSRTIVDRVLSTREAACVLDTFSDAQLKAQASIQDLQVRSVMCVPLLVGAHLLGALYVDSRVALGAFTAEDLRMLGAIAAQAAVALDSARLHHALQQELKRKQAYIQQLESSENVIRHLQDLDRVRAEYFQAASHDLRGPLASIQVSCQALLKGVMEPLNEDQSGAISGIQHSSRSLMALIDGILDRAQLDAGQLLLHPRPVALAKPVRDAVLMLSALAQDRGLRLEWDEAAFAALPPVLGDERRLAQVVLNLLTNAIKFTEQGGVRLSAELAGPGVTLAIADSGPGLPPERQANPFERYAAGPSAASGNGLGLWMVKGLVELHRGRIAVESTPAGTTFRIWLPLASD